jgi:hypothetical protein
MSKRYFRFTILYYFHSEVFQDLSIILINWFVVFFSATINRAIEAKKHKYLMTCFWDYLHQVSWDNLHQVSWDNLHQVSWDNLHQVSWDNLLQVSWDNLLQVSWDNRRLSQLT